MPEQPQPDPKSELNKMGTGQQIDHAKMWEQMDESRLDKALRSCDRLIAEREAEEAAKAAGS